MKLLVTSILLSASMLLTATQSASGRPNDCLEHKEEAATKETAIRKFPKYNIQIELPVNYRSVLLNTGEILLVDSGTYKYLRCIQVNSHGLGKGIIGILITDPINNNIQGELKYELLEDDKYIVWTKDFNYLALRILHSNAATDIQIFGSDSSIESVKFDIE